MIEPESSAPTERSRVKIEKLLRKWGCRKIGWLEETDVACEIQFVFHSEDGTQLAARFMIDLKPPKGKTERQLELVLRGRFRTLLLFLEGAVRAVELGIIKPEQVFLAWLAGPDGRTIWEVVQPRLRQLESGGAMALLGAGK